MTTVEFELFPPPMFDVRVIIFTYGLRNQMMPIIMTGESRMLSRCAPVSSFVLDLAELRQRKKHFLS